MKIHIWSGRVTLEELFLEGRPDDQKYEHLMKVARLKVISVFRMADSIKRKSEYADPDTVYTKANSFEEWYDKRVAEYEKGERRPHYTDNYLLDVDNDVDQLVDYVSHRIKGVYQFVAVKDLPVKYQGLVDEWRDIVRNAASRMLIERAIKRMAAAQEIYFINNEWQARQSLIDEAKCLSRELKGIHPKHRVPRNSRPFHGKANTTANRKSQYHGGSVGNAKQ